MGVIENGQIYKVKEIPFESATSVSGIEKKNRKTKMLTCRVTEEEFNIIKERKVRTYDIFRKYLYKERIPKRTVEKKKIEKREDPLNAQFVAQITGIATNLNQLTKLCNTYKNAPELDELEKIRKEISSVIQNYKNIH
ncbi:MAG: plasmid mobilization relaxosome protein MobC [Methanobacteriaceae archaeon]|nr:plasmid mobilization relaxosome protein MobC [Methanobacteriaceae archaeon]